MKQTARAWFSRRILASLALLAVIGSPALADIKTNWVDRWITNVVEVYVPANRFVTEYHTNLVLRAHTNVVNVYRTNVVTARLTNKVDVALVRTNFVQAYHTNYKTLVITNWTTVLVLKTNWVQRTLTNVAELELPRTEFAALPPSKSPGPPTVPGASADDALIIEATRGTKRAPNQVDVRLNAHWADQGQAPVQVRQWKIQSEDGSLLCFGQEQEFRRNLALGLYTIDLKAQRDTKSEAVTARATLSVGSSEVKLLEQRMLAKR